MGKVIKNGNGFDDLTNAIVKDVEQSVKNAQKKIDKITLKLNLPTREDLLNWRTPLIIENKGKVTIHGERNPHLVFEDNNSKKK